MPAGMGKSIVIGLLAGLLELNYNTVTLVYTDSRLRDFEEPMIV